MHTLKQLLLSALALSATLSAHAESWYTNLSAFLSAPVTTQEKASNYPTLTGVPSFSHNDVTFTAIPPSSFITKEWTTTLSGNDIAISGNEDFDIEFEIPIPGFGIQFRDAPGSEPSGGSTTSQFTIRLYNDTTFVSQFSFNTSLVMANFIGVTDAALFNRVEIREDSDANENEFFGWVWTQTRSGTPGDNLTVLGGTCVGLDCNNGKDFGSDEMILAENNLRIRWVDEDLTPGLAQSWSMDGNRTSNGGASHLLIGLKSLTEDTIALSDGTAPEYDCSVGTDNFDFPPIIGTIPLDEPALTPQFRAFIDGKYYWDCLEDPDFTRREQMIIGPENGGVRLMRGAQASDDHIVIGAAILKQRLAHVASAIAATDTINVGDLAALNPLNPTLEPQRAALQNRLDLVDAALFELNVLLDLFESDEDGDNLSFYRETYVHFTDPNNADTDGDSLSDGAEVSLGLNPTDECDGPMEICGGNVIQIILEPDPV